MLKFFGFSKPQRKTTVLQRENNFQPRRIVNLNGHTGSILTLRQMADERLVSAAPEGVRIWNIATGECENTISESATTMVCSLQDGRLVIDTHSGSHAFFIVYKSKKLIRGFRIGGYGEKSTDPIIHLELQNGRLARASQGGILIFSKSLKPVRVEIAKFTEEITAMIQLQSGKLVSGSADGKIHVWDPNDGHLVNTLEIRRADDSKIIGLIQHTDGRLISLVNHQIEFWNVLSGECERFIPLKNHEENRKIIAENWKGKVTKASAIGTLFYEERSLPCGLKQLPNGQLIVIERNLCGLVLSAQIYDPSTYTCLESIIIEEGATATAIQMELLSDGLLAISINNMIKIWDLGFRPVLEVSAQSVLSTQAVSTTTLEQTSKESSEINIAPAQSPAFSPPSSIPTIPLSEIKIDYATRLGSGGYADVFKGTWGGTEVAIKKLQTDVLAEKTLISFQNEAKKHADFRHPNIVILYGIALGPNQYFMIMAKMSCSLRDLLLNATPLTMVQKYVIAQGIAEGLCYLHSNGVIHRDLKSGNILIDVEKNYLPYISDFGLSEIKSDIENQKSSADSRKQTITGSPRWMAPELFKNWPCTVQTDVYAFGVVLWEILTKETPFGTTASTRDIAARVRRGERPVIPEGSPVAFVNLMKGCWQQNPKKRPAEFRLIADTLRLFKLQQSKRDELHLKSQTDLSDIERDTLDDCKPGFRTTVSSIN